MISTAKNMMLDRTAIGLSVVCVLHCLALPLLLVLAPSLAALPFANEEFHLVLVLFVIPISTAALFVGCRRHRDRSVLVWGLSGVAVLILAAVFGHDMLGEAGEKAMTVLGATLVAIGHIRNFRLCRSAACAQ